MISVISLVSCHFYFKKPPSEEKPELVEVVVVEVNLHEVYHGCIKQIEYERTMKGNYNNTIELMKLDVTIDPGVKSRSTYYYFYFTTVTTTAADY